MVNRRVIVRACDQYPDCCGRELSVKKDSSDSQEGSYGAALAIS